MYFLSSLQLIFIVSFLGWIQMLWPWFILELHFITVEELFCVAGVLVCFDMFWDIEERTPRALSFIVVDFFHPMAFPFFY